MRINTNISALKANNSLNRSNNALSKSLERLSSGYRINSAADDAAGMAISQKMRTQIAGLNQANRNSSDGVSLIQTAEGALSEVTSIVQRMRQLSVQAANGTNTDADREAIQAEIDNLNEEINRISTTTEFNTVKLLDGSADRKSFSNVPGVSLVSASDTVDVGHYELKVTQDARQAVLTGFNIDGLTYPVGSGDVGVIDINGIDVSIEEGDTKDEVFTKIRDAAERTNVTVFAAAADATVQVPTKDNASTAQYEAVSLNATDPANKQLIFVSKEYGSEQKITINCSNASLAGKVGLPTSEVSVTGHDVKAELTFGADSKFNKTATIATSGNNITITDQNGFEMKFETSAIVDVDANGTPATTYGAVDKSLANPAQVPTAKASNQEVKVTVLSAGSIKLQVGANEGQTVEVAIPRVNCKTLGIENCNLTTSEGAQKAITLYDNAVTTVSAIRSKLGAYQNRLDHTSSNLGTAEENMTEALSRIEDTDMASEMANYTQKNVLVQAGTSMLAQANQRPQTILSLLNA